MYYTVIKHSGHLGTLEKCRKHSPAARVFYISLLFSNARSVLSQCNTRLRLLYLLNIPYLTFSQFVWHFCRASDSRTRKVQERILRAIYCDRSSSYDKLLSMANLCTLLTVTDGCRIWLSFCTTQKTKFVLSILQAFSV